MRYLNRNYWEQQKELAANQKQQQPTKAEIKVQVHSSSIQKLDIKVLFVNGEIF
jgi:hypothetical protein